MADRSTSDSRHVLSLAAQPPPPISKDNQGSDNSIPLSPQWLLPKLGESKHESGNEDEHSGSFLNNAKHLDIPKSSGNSEEIVDPPKKKDIFRPSLLDQETSRLDRWRDEERDTNSSVRRDRWREGDKEPTENRKTDRWTDKSASKHYGETQRAVPDRWGDSSNKDSGYERRESKWTNRWGPNDKDKEVSHEKSQEFGKVRDMMYDKGLPSQSTHRKDEREGDAYRPWRSNSTHGRGRGESLNSQTLTPSKGSAFSYGRGRIENQPPAFGHTHGRPNMLTSGNNFGAHSQSSRLVSDKLEIVHVESSFFKYSRAKLLDVYRNMDKRSSWKLVDGFVEVPSLTQEELSDPLGLSAPSPEEAVILMGIDKGDILSSGAPVNNKEGPAERLSSEFSQSRQPKIGSREDLSHAIDGSIDDDADGGYSNHLEGGTLDKQARHFSAQRTYGSVMPTPEEESTPLHKSGELSASRDLGVQRNAYVPPGSSWRSPSFVEHARLPSSEVRDVSDDRQSSNHNFVRSQHLKDPSDNHENGSAYKLYHKIEPKWQVGGRPVIETQSSVFLDRENESRMLPSPSPEDLILLYKDPRGNIQGPFSGSDIIGWYDAGYFGIDLQVRLAAASKDQPFSLLGDVMPHLRSKARPPPGFSIPKQSEPLDVSSRLSYSNSGKLLVNSSEIDPLKNDLRPMHGFSTDADNRYLESLMTGTQGYFGNNSSSVSPIGVDNANLYLLAQKMALEQQRSWTGRDPTPMISKPEIGPESASVHPKLHSPMIDNIRSIPPSQNSELLAMLNGASERSSSGFNSAASSWPNFPVQGGSITDNLDLYHGQNIHQPSAFGIQQQMLQAQNNPSLINLLSQTNPASVLKPENTPAMPQDPHALNMLQQQYLIHLHSQTPAPLQQLSVLDKLLLLQQQQKQSEQQQLLMQQNILAQTLSESLPHQRPGMLSYGLMQASAMPGGDVNQPEYRLAHEQLIAGTQTPAPNDQDENSSNLHKVNPQILQEASKLNSQSPQEIIRLRSQIPQDVSKLKPNAPQDVWKLDPQVLQEVTDSHVSAEVSKSSEASLRLPHQFSKDTTNQKTGSYEHHSEIQRRGGSIMAEIADGSTSLDKPSATNSAAIFSLPTESRKHSGAPTKSAEASALVSAALHDNDMSKASGSSTMNPNDASSDRIIERDQIIREPTKVKEVKNVETREVKKGSEKKTRKQKASKSSEQEKGVLKTALPPIELSATEGTNLNVSEGDLLATGDYVSYLQNQPGLDISSDKKAQQTLSGYANVLKDSDESLVLNEQKAAGGFPSQNIQSHPGQRAWKPAPGFKPKSLLEIQQEEKRRAQAEVQTTAIASSANSTSLSTPWAGVVSIANTDTKTSKGTYVDMGSTELISERALKPKSSKSQLHDLLTDKVNLKSIGVEMHQDNQKFTSPEPLAPDDFESTDDLDFIQAKDTKKSRKKSGKTKVASSKVISVSPDASLGSSPIEKIKSSRHAHQEKEILPAVPSGPSLGDFVVWKGESPNISSHAPAWSTDSGKVQPILLRDILKEQEKKTPPLPTPQKPQSTQPAHGSVPSRSLGALSLSKAPAPTQVTSISTQSKHSGDEDLFWGPIDSSKQEAKQSDFPQLGNYSSRGVKSSTPLKGSIGGLTKQKFVAGKTADYSHSSSPQSSLKGRQDAMSKQTEAMDFRDWCQAESIRLIGTKDTSFLEFCLKQTRSEAEILLVENLGSYDPNHEFIDKFLNYKELLPAEVLDIAFQSHNDWKSSSGQTSFSTAAVAESNPEPPSVKGGGKKKSKKGKKVSPSVLGFNVVSNRIMMGEIQTAED